MYRRLVMMGIILLGLGIDRPVPAQTCTPLQVVRGEGTSVTKRISPPNAGTIPGLPVGYRGNWDTDFLIPGGSNFNSYIAVVRSESTEAASFRVKMYLKYPDDTADKVYNNEVELQPGQSQDISATPRTEVEPYQVNLNIGGYDSIGYSYTASVEGCP
ncbi:MAG: hypothetical protein ACFBSC_18610 [Microcoleaceae cyanobacterium]